MNSRARLMFPTCFKTLLGGWMGGGRRRGTGKELREQGRER